MMKESDKEALLARYKLLSDNDFIDMFKIDAAEYDAEVYKILLEAAKLRDLQPDKIKLTVDQAISTEKAKSLEESIKKLTSFQRGLFTALPGLAYWYSIFTPSNWKERKSEAGRCQIVGIRNYLILAAVLFVVVGIPKWDIFIYCILGIIALQVYLHFKDKKQPGTRKLSPTLKKLIAKEGLIFLCVFPVLVSIVVWCNSTQNNVVAENAFLLLFLVYGVYLIIRSYVIGNTLFPATIKQRVIKEVLMMGTPIIFVVLLAIANRVFSNKDFLLEESLSKIIFETVGIAFFLLIIPFYIIRFIIWAIKNLR